VDTTRRDFLKTTAIASTGLAIPAIAHATIVSGHTDSSAGLLAQAGTRTAVLPTRGIGLYPGAALENFDARTVLNPAAPYGNLALLRPAFASSSYDYNLTAQLVTDGIVDAQLPHWLTTVVNGQISPKQAREHFVDHAPENVSELTDANPMVEFHIGGGDPPEIDRVDLFAVVPEHIAPATLTFTVSISEDAQVWKAIGTTTGATVLDPVNYPPDLVRGSVVLAPSIPFAQPTRSRFYRVEFATAAASETAGRTGWRLGQVEFYHGAARVEISGPYNFTSAWKGAGLEEEWIYVDLGARFSFDRVALHWIARASEGKLQASDDAVAWQDIQSLPDNPPGLNDDIRFVSPSTARYVRVLMTRAATADGYILSEFEVFGHGGFLVKAAAASPSTAETLTLSGGSWRLQRGPQVSATGESISVPGFATSSWLVATVPGTVLTSYFNAGAIPDPNFGQNQLHISDSFFYSDFWYRTEFPTPAHGADELLWLNFEGVNWKADVYLNGEKLGSIDGGFIRGRFEVSSKLHAGKPNALAVLIRKNQTPGSCKQKTYASTGKNGGGLGSDNPTYHASIGWDWIPTIRGRNTGIWAEVALSKTGAVTLEDPLVTSALPLPDISKADLSLEVIAVNHTAKPVSGTLRGTFGTISFAQPIQLGAAERQVVRLSAATHPQLRIVQPQLWWPTGYGDPHLYDVKLSFEAAGKTHHRLPFKAGIRQMTATEDDGKLRLFINGRRFIARGGNWGFGESMLRYRAREYDAAVRYHREQNFTMIRNWVGQIGDDEFYQACDRHGIVVWQDFWLANPWDGPIPEDNALFLANARDYLLRIRRHASIGLYCGRNEWYPPAPLETGLRQLLAELHPGIAYIGSSANGPVGGGGPYRTLSTPNYFRSADQKLHSEIGAPTIPSIESVRLMMPKAALWPQGLDWGLHDFTLAGAQGGSAMLTLIDNAYGGPTNATEWVALAQFLNYDTYRAIFEAQSKYRMGALLWMSHPCWPSFVWQTYDYYLEPTAAYFGARKGAEPLHIQWNSLTEDIEVVNYSAPHSAGMTAQVEVLNLDGKVIQQKTFPIESKEDSTQIVTRMEYPVDVSAVHFLRLTLKNASTTVSSNFYMRGTEQGDYRAIRTLAKATIVNITTAEKRGATWSIKTKISNTSSTPALMLRLKAVREKTRDRILPVLHDDNYIALMPGESRTVYTQVEVADARGERPVIILDGFNVASA
jgi:Exo-beta-D-glucosaminidase Ig-fold domain/F5/8 type C domain/Glycosyl hydrolases family 2